MPSQRTIALEYHDIVSQSAFDSSGFPGHAAASYKLTVERFTEHLAVLAALSQRLIPLAADRSLQLTPGRDLVLTFDDGGISASEHIAPLLEARGLRGFFFVTTDRIDTNGFLTSAQIADLHRRGHAIGSHSCSHPTRMSALSRSDLGREWSDSLGRLAAIVGQPVVTASVPGGYYSRAVGEAAAAAGIRVLFTSEPSARIARLGECAIVGRYTLRRQHSARHVAALVGASSTARRIEWLRWNGKKGLKAIGGRAYLRVRDMVFGEP